MSVLKSALITMFGAGTLWVITWLHGKYYAEIQAAPMMYRAIWVGYFVAFAGVTLSGAYHTIRGLFR